MRKLQRFALLFAVLLVATPSVWADDRADALVIVDDAIKAHGGAEALTKSQTLTRADVGNLTLFDKELPFTGVVTMSLPDRIRITAEIDKRLRTTTVLNGDKGWRSEGGPAAELGATRVKEVAEEAYIFWLATLTPLKKAGFDLKPVAEAKVNGKAASGVLVSSKGHVDAKLYFDKTSHLLVKIEREAPQGTEKVTMETIYANHKEVDGVKLPATITENVNGKKLSAFTATYTLLSKVDDATFAKP